MEQKNTRTSRFVIEVGRAVAEADRTGAASVMVRVYEEDDGMPGQRPLLSMSNVDGDQGQSGCERLRVDLHRLIDDIVDRMRDTDSAEVTLWSDARRRELLEPRKE